MFYLCIVWKWNFSTIGSNVCSFVCKQNVRFLSFKINNSRLNGINGFHIYVWIKFGKKLEHFYQQSYIFLVGKFNLLYIKDITTAVIITPIINPPNNVPSVTPMLMSFGNIDILACVLWLSKMFDVKMPKIIEWQFISKRQSYRWFLGGFFLRKLMLWIKEKIYNGFHHQMATWLFGWSPEKKAIHK